MKVTKTLIPDVLVIEPEAYGDERGFFMESWNQAGFDQAIGRTVTFVQDNFSRSQHGVLRGLHYQIKHPQGKLVRVSQGCVFDVAVDIRKNSDTFGACVGEYLSAENNRQLWIPEGLAHGFLVISNQVDFMYKTTDYYDPASQRTLRWDAPELSVNWPLDKLNCEPILAEKDKTGLELSQVG